MRAAFITAPHRIELREVPSPTPGADEVLIEIEQCGVCASDIDLWSGRGDEPFPVAIGHEVAGKVIGSGAAVSRPDVGERVTAWVEGGGFAEQVTAKADHCVPVGESIAYPAVGEPLSCIINAVELAAPSLGDDIVIIGAGFMGTLLQLVTQLKGPRSVIVADLRTDRLERAARLGATRVVDTTRESLASVVAEQTNASGCDIAYEATGAQGGLDLAAEVTRMSGKLAIVGYHLGAPRSVDLGRWNWMAFQIVNAHFRDLATIMTGMRAGMRLVNSGRIVVDPLVSHRFGLDDISQAFEVVAAMPESLVKAVVEPALRG